MGNDRGRKQDVYDRLREFAAYVVLSLFALLVIINIADDLFFGDHIKGVDPLMYGLVGTLITLVFAGKVLDKK